MSTIVSLADYLHLPVATSDSKMPLHILACSEATSASVYSDGVAPYHAGSATAASGPVLTFVGYKTPRAVSHRPSSLPWRCPRTTVASFMHLGLRALPLSRRS